MPADPTHCPQLALFLRSDHTRSEVLEPDALHFHTVFWNSPDAREWQPTDEPDEMEQEDLSGTRSELFFEQFGRY